MSAPRLIVPGLYELRLSMPLSSVNVFFLLTAEGVTLIDTGYPDRGIGVLAGLSALGRTSADIRHIIVTHHHIDHAGNLATLQTLSNATVWMHPSMPKKSGTAEHYGQPSTTLLVGSTGSLPNWQQ